MSQVVDRPCGSGSAHSRCDLLPSTIAMAMQMPPNQKSVDCLPTPTPNRPNVLTSTPSRDYKVERQRLESFAGYPSNSVDVRQLAKAGFFFTKSEDIVRCAFCDVEVGRWEEGDNPAEEHKKWSKNCPFLSHPSAVDNVAISPSDPPPPLPQLEPYGFDECGIFNIKKSDNCPIVPSLEKLGIHKRYSPAHPSYITLEARLESFESWPSALKLRPQELAEAGFFYTGLGDKTICFQCGGGLKDWAETDEPWREHALYFSKCGYVVQTKGREFIGEVLGKRPATLTPEEIKALAIPKEYSNVVQQRPQSASSSTTEEVSSSEANVEENVEENESSAIAPSTSAPSKSSATKQVDDARACKICFTEEIGVVFLPCGHLVSCVSCASSLTTCAVCREPLVATVRAYLS
ncbi:death-associated inhibitor of apoptosis 1-like isoform X2 [Thrips palmi]|uniref:Death-associated inhibitor of apoptosis 1-like isoform X2 n=1 Tax=Thrips palmi TaxID=161013 RepID=A0A6P9A6Y0_THRPL|nr:death-associated inhibitor of apoptosis 1-like isoform X2 [Thrips palmi]